MLANSKTLPDNNKKSATITSILIGLALLSAVLAIYGQTWKFGAISLDDSDYLFKNPHITADLSFDSLKWTITGVVKGYWGPSVWLSFLLEYRIWHDWPGGYHLTNVFLHMLNSILLFLLFRKLLSDIWCAALIAILFAIHPLHTESVCWITERKDVLFMFFGLLTLHAYCRWISKPSFAHYGVVFSLFCLGLASKPMLVTLPAVLLLLDYWPLKRLSFKQFGPRLFEKIPLIIAAIASSVLTVWFNMQSGPVDTLANLPMHHRLANALYSYTIYLKDIFWPTHIEFYPLHQGMPPHTELYLSIMVLLIISGIAVYKARTRPFIIVGWLWFLGTLIPVIGIFQLAGQAMGARFAYFPAIGIYLIVATLIRKIKWAGMPVSTIVTIPLILLLSVIAEKQVGYWRSSESLYRHTISISPLNYWAWGALAYEKQKQNKLVEAFKLYRKTIELKPNYLPAHAQIAQMCLEEGNRERNMKKKIALYGLARRHLDVIEKYKPGTKKKELTQVNDFFKLIKAEK